MYIFVIKQLKAMTNYIDLQFKKAQRQCHVKCFLMKLKLCLNYVVFIIFKTLIKCLSDKFQDTGYIEVA